MTNAVCLNNGRMCFSYSSNYYVPLMYATLLVNVIQKEQRFANLFRINTLDIAACRTVVMMGVIDAVNKQEQKSARR